jgi:hypothetical protein
MVQIIEDPRHRKGAAMAQALGMLGGMGARFFDDVMTRRQERHRTEEENKRIQQITGQNPSGLSPEMKQLLFKEYAKSAADMDFLRKLGKTSNEQQSFNQGAGNGLSGQYFYNQLNQQTPQEQFDQDLYEQDGSALEQPPLSQPNQPNGMRNASGRPQLNERQRMGLAMVNPALARAMQSEQKEGRRQFESDRSFESQQSSPILKRVEDLANGLGERESTYNLMEQGVANTKGGVLNWDYAAKKLGIPGLSAAAGAMDAASKNYVIETLHRLPGGTRGNQFLERMSLSAVPEIGAAQNNKWVKLQSVKFNLDSDKKFVELASELAQKDRDQYGYVRGDLNERVQKEMVPWTRQRLNQMSYDVKSLIEDDQNDAQLKKYAKNKVPTGTVLTPRMAMIFQDMVRDKVKDPSKVGEKAEKLARQQGYTILPDEFYENQMK